MINYDMHIHTEYCGHAPGMSVKAIIEAAERKGLEVIAITSHVFSEADLAILPQIRNDIARIKTDVKVLVGAEIDADGMRTDGVMVTDNFDDLDYVLGTMHYIPTTGIYPKLPDDNPLSGDEFFKVWESTLLGLVSNPRLDALAHPGRLAACSCDLEVYFDDMLAVFEKAAKISVKNEICWGLNELNERKVPEAYHERWDEIYQVAIDAGVGLVYGSDAHSPEEVGKQSFCQKTLEAIGPVKLETPRSMGLV